MDRLEDIRRRLNLGDEVHRDWYEDDVSFLLQRIEHLQRENERLKTDFANLYEEAQVMITPNILTLLRHFANDHDIEKHVSRQSDTLT